MSEERKTIDQITRTLTSFLGTEYIPGRDGTGDFKATVASLVLYATAGGTKKEIDDADETILDTDVYKTYTFDNLTANRDLNLPTLADNDGKEIYVINLDGSYDVNLTPEGSDDINDWNVAFPITEKYGILKVVALSGRWFVKPLNDACIYEVSSETADTGLSLDGTWDDVTDMHLLNGVYGKFLLEAKMIQRCFDSSFTQRVAGFWGLGTVSGNNSPDIIGGGEDENETNLASGNTNYALIMSRFISNVPYTSDASTIFMKAKIITDELNATSHEARGAIDCPLYIRARRLY